MSMHTFYETEGCCGHAEYYGISNTNWSVESMFRWMSDYGCTYGVISLFDVYCGRGGSTKLRQLQAYVRRHKLGSVRIGKPAINPNTGNFLFPAIWSVNEGALERHLYKVSERKDALYRARDWHI